MPRVKIVTMIHNSTYDGDYSVDTNVISGSATGWEEISEEDLKLLKERWYYVNQVGNADCLHLDARGRPSANTTSVPVLLVENEITVLQQITSIKQLVDKERKEREAAEIAREEKRQLAEQKRAQKKLEKQQKQAQDKQAELAALELRTSVLRQEIANEQKTTQN